MSSASVSGLTPAQTKTAEKMVKGGSLKDLNRVRSYVAKHKTRGNTNKIASRILKLSRRGYKKS